MTERLLEGKVAVITGAGSGIGRAIALLFAEHGASVAVIDRDLDGAALTVNAIERQGGRARAYQCNIVREAEVVAAMGGVVRDFGAIHILVNNAGILFRRRAVEVTEKEWELQFGVNVRGAFYCSREAAKVMIPQREGRIICISSIAGFIPMLDMAAYCASKAALAQLARVLALELAPYGILVNVVAPGSTDREVPGFPFTPRAPAEVEGLVKGSLQSFQSGVPLGRLLTTREQARAVLFFASPWSSGATGQVLHVAGGQDML